MSTDVNQLLGCVFDIKELREQYIKGMEKIATAGGDNPAAQNVVLAGMESLTDWYAEEMDKLIEALCVAAGGEASTIAVETGAVAPGRMH
jgi:hypothetical protein